MELEGRILGCLQTNYLDVILYLGYGQVDGGVLWRIPLENFPKERAFRMPNTILIIQLDSENNEIIKITPKLHL